MPDPLYLTQAQLPYDVVARWGNGHGFQDRYDWHQRLWECFPNRDGEDRDFLSRVDPKQEHLQLLILSETEPVRPNWCPDHPEDWRTATIPATFYEAAAYQFKLLANPTKKVRTGKDGSLLKNSRRIPVTNREELIEWLQRKGEQSGFTFDPARLRTFTRPKEQFYKKGTGRGVLHAVDFNGVLSVTDRERFRAALARGIGPARAFGFGMLILSPLS